MKSPNVGVNTLTPNHRLPYDKAHNHLASTGARNQMSGHKRIRQIDVAKRAGVSTAVVSSVLSTRSSGSIRVGAAAKRRVWEAVRELGYVPNLVATSLANGERRLFGVFTFEPVFTERHRGFYVPFLLGVEREAEVHGYDLVLFTSTSGSGRRRSIFAHGANRLGLAAGAILLGREPDKDEVTRLLRESYPFVFIGRREMEGGAIAYVAADYATATAEIVRRLLALGHTRVRLIDEGGATEGELDRRRGYREACSEAGHAAGEIDESIYQAARLTPAWIASAVADGVTALIVANDSLGRSALDAVRSHGLDVPGDLSLAVLGDPIDDPDNVPDWLSFTIPRLEMGRESVRLLERVAAGAPPETAQVTLPCTIVDGSTAGPPKSSPR